MNSDTDFFVFSKYKHTNNEKERTLLHRYCSRAWCLAAAELRRRSVPPRSGWLQLDCRLGVVTDCSRHWLRLRTVVGQGVPRFQQDHVEEDAAVLRYRSRLRYERRQGTRFGSGRNGVHHSQRVRNVGARMAVRQKTAGRRHTDELSYLVGNSHLRRFGDSCGGSDNTCQG